LHETSRLKLDVQKDTNRKIFLLGLCLLLLFLIMNLFID